MAPGNVSRSRYFTQRCGPGDDRTLRAGTDDVVALRGPRSADARAEADASAYFLPAAQPSCRAPDSPTMIVLLSPSGIAMMLVCAFAVSTPWTPSVPG